MPSVISGSDNFNSAAGAGLKAWVNFNGTGTVAIRASYGVSSLTDSGVGLYTVNFSTAMPDINATVVGTCRGQNNDSDSTIVGISSSASATAGIRTKNNSNSAVDSDNINVAVFR